MVWQGGEAGCSDGAGEGCGEGEGTSDGDSEEETGVGHSDWARRSWGGTVMGLAGQGS